MAKAERSVQINETLSVKLSGKKSLRLCDDYCDGNPSEDLQPIPFPVQVEGTLYFWAD